MTSRSFLNAAVLIAVSARLALAQEVVFETVLDTAMPVPGDPTLAFSSFGTPTINNDDDLAFPASFDFGVGGVTIDNFRSGWIRQDDELRQIARMGDARPDLGGVVLEDLIRGPSINNAGAVLFSVDLSPDSLNPEYAYVVDTDGVASIVVRQHTPIPDLGGASLEQMDYDTRFTDGGRFYFGGKLEVGGTITEDNDRGLWLWDGAGVVELFREGAGIVDVINADGAAITPSGSVAAYVRFYDDAEEFTRGVFTVIHGISTEIAREGQPAPGAGGAEFASLSLTPRINDADAVAFSARLTDPVTGTSASGVWVSRDGSLDLIAHTGDPAPPSGTPFDYVATPVINAGGDVFFCASLEPPAGGVGDRGLWVAHDDGTLEQLTRASEEPAFSHEVCSIGPIAAANSRGDVLFYTSAPGAESRERAGLWLYARSHARVLKIAVIGEPFESAPNPGAVVASIYTPTNAGLEDGWPRAMNESGTIAFSLAFDDGTAGLYLARVVDPCNPADLDGNGALNFDDLDAWIAAYLAGDPAADLDGSGTLDLDDLDAFVASYLAGCP